MTKTKPSKTRHDPRRHRVIWTDVEKRTLILKAVQIQRVRPYLAGLPLLRQAMGELDPGRQRKVIALSHVPWFEPGVIAEAERLASIERSERPTPVIQVPNPSDPYLPVLSAFRDILARHHEASTRILEEIRDELRAIRQSGESERE